MKKSLILKIFDTACLVLLFAMIADVLLQVFFRFVLSISVPMTEELAKVFYSVLIFLSIVLCEAEDLQLKTTYFLDKLPYKLRLFVYALTSLLSFSFFICLLIGGARMFASSIHMSYGTMPWLPRSTEYVSPVLCAPFALFYMIKRVIHFRETTAEHMKEYKIVTEEEDAE